MLECGHEGTAFGDRLCIHLRTCREPWIKYLRWYNGTALTAELLCLSCAEHREQGGQVAVGAVCENCFTYASTEVGEVTGVRGQPGIAIRDEPFDTTLVRTELPAEIGTIVDLAPIQGSTRSEWLLLTADDALVRLDADTREWKQLARATLRSESDREPWNGHRSKPHLYVSHHGDFAALVNDYGRYGQVIDLQRDTVTLALDGGEYHEDTVPFSFAFAQLRDRAVAIHRSEWNRLELSDPASGALLAERARTSSSEGDQSYLDPEHYLDYFHGALYVSPRSGHVLDDGWVWHPVGLPATWSLDRWLHANVWESENGPTRQHVCDPRAYYWGGAACWIDEERVVLGAIGDDDILMIDGARVFDISASDVSSSNWRQARELLAFPGPAGDFFSDGAALFSSASSGLSRWSLSDGARTGFLAGFRPAHHHRGAGELVQLVDRTLVRWRTG